jgi:hypothetical protein
VQNRLEELGVYMVTPAEPAQAAETPPVSEGRPEDLPGIDYDRPGDVKRKQPSGDHNPYPYSPEEDEEHFREIFRKKREANGQGMAEGSNNLHIPNSDKMSDEERHEAILAKHPEATRVGKTPGQYRTKDGDLISGISGVRKLAKDQGMAEGLTNFDSLSDAELIRLAHRGYISGNLEYNEDGALVNRDEIIRLLKTTDDAGEDYDDDLQDPMDDEQGMAEGDNLATFEGLLGTLGGAAAGMALGGPIGAAIGAVGGQELTSGGSWLIESECNQTMEGEYCPEHGLAECGNYGMYESELARIKSLALIK